MFIEAATLNITLIQLVKYQSGKSTLASSNMSISTPVSVSVPTAVDAPDAVTTQLDLLQALERL